MLQREREKEEELVMRTREVKKGELIKIKKRVRVRDFQIPGFVRGFEINRFKLLKSMMDLGGIQILLILCYPN